MIGHEKSQIAKFRCPRKLKSQINLPAFCDADAPAMPGVDRAVLKTSSVVALERRPHVPRPAHPTAFHPVLGQVTLDHSRGDRIPLTQIFVVSHPLGMLL